MEKKKLVRTLYLTIASIIVLSSVLIGATYAWFTFSPYTNVTPMSGAIGQGDANLLISNQQNGAFDRECALILDSTGDVLSPLSTVDLNGFYEATAQNRDGISILFSDASDQVDTKAMHGKVYLKCENGDCAVYLRGSGLDLGQDAQTLAALRLGMKISTARGQHTYIMNLDALGNTGLATAKATVFAEDSVVSSVDGQGNASFVADPSVDISRFLAVEQGANDQEPKAGQTALCTIGAGEIITVEYWLYLEGCDDNCIGDVQEKDIGIQLAFAGVVAQ